MNDPIELNAQATDEQCQEVAWEMFCMAHPHEAHDLDPDKFWKYFQTRAPHLSREEMVALLKECQE